MSHARNEDDDDEDERRYVRQRVQMDGEDTEEAVERYEWDNNQYTNEEFNAAETTAILDSGADHTTIPISLATQLPWPLQHHNDNIVMRYGNNATLQSLGMIDVGNYTIYVMPEEANQPLVSLGEIVDNRHIITLYPEYGTIQHETGLYTLKFPREVLNENIHHTRQWMVPISILHQLNLQAQHWQQDIEYCDDEARAQQTEREREQRMQEYLHNQSQHQAEDEATRSHGYIPGLHLPGLVRYYGTSEDGKEDNVHLEYKGDNEEYDQIVYNDDSGDEDGMDNISRAFSARLHVTPKTDRERVINLHERMGHAPEDVMTLAVEEQNHEWINTGVTSEMIHKIFSKEA